MVRFGRKPSWSFPDFKARLPDHYYEHQKRLNYPSSRVHDRPKDTDYYDLIYNKQRHKVERVADTPIPVIYPPEADVGIWGGEGIVKGYVKPRKYFEAGKIRPKYWFPNLKRAVFYSEILDKYFRTICTRRTLELVDKHYGFDSYILRTEVQDLKSGLALNLRRIMLLTLIRKDFKDPKHCEEMVDKYRDCLIPEEEAEWVGLSVRDAMVKQKLIDAKANKAIPLKATLTQELIEELQKMKDSGELDIIMKDEDKTNWFNKFKSKIPFLKANQ
ncbi:unnamed protein product [Medioppia subpectinata]|uniref:Large ribosomal subunit protein bL28m n=1 Tax=Medioppia subpectinata TaxID=1979941 RepID=A0A7R9KF73_9ACAR|nr:unnamed protein product [Medioppia subpectinata]CAG2102223.1 unnamed protein product [Medioppia subpectinata]